MNFSDNVSFVMDAPGLAVSLPDFPEGAQEMKTVMERQCTAADPCMALLIEDDEAICKLIELRSQREGAFRTLRIGLLEDAIAYLGTYSCDVILLDLGLPDSEGMESLERVIAAVSDRIPVVVWSGRMTAQLEADLLRAGAQEALEKPLAAAALLKMLRSAVARHRTRRHLREQNEHLEEIINTMCITCEKVGNEEGSPLEQLKAILNESFDFVESRKAAGGGASTK